MSYRKVKESFDGKVTGWGMKKDREGICSICAWGWLAEGYFRQNESKGRELQIYEGLKENQCGWKRENEMEQVVWNKTELGLVDWRDLLAWLGLCIFLRSGGSLRNVVRSIYTLKSSLYLEKKKIKDWRKARADTAPSGEVCRSRQEFSGGDEEKGME